MLALGQHTLPQLALASPGARKDPEGEEGRGGAFEEQRSRWGLFTQAPQRPGRREAPTCANNARLHKGQPPFLGCLMCPGLPLMSLPAGLRNSSRPRAWGLFLAGPQPGPAGLWDVFPALSTFRIVGRESWTCCPSPEGLLPPCSAGQPHTPRWASLPLPGKEARPDWVSWGASGSSFPSLGRLGCQRLHVQGPRPH